MGDLVGVVLGGGSSTRLGRPKQLLRLGEGTLLEHVVRDVERSSLARVVVVVGGAVPRAAVPFVPRRSELVENDGYGDGCAASLLAGLDAAADCDGIVLLLGDMPGVTAAVIDAVVRSWRDHETWAAVTHYTDGVGHPFVFSADAFPRLRGLHGDKAVWKIVDSEPIDRVARIRIDRALPLDVDTWEDYERVCASFGVEPEPREHIARSDV